MSMRPKTKFLVAVWGNLYIERFLSLALPSFLAKGNLPALAEATDLEVVIMTRRRDIAPIDTHPAIERLRAICPLRYVEIDDLITTSVYGVTLTLAYARPIISCGEEMLETYFVFMNADFVLADGSLRALSRRILAGHAIVLGPSFRAVAEAVEPILREAPRESPEVLAIPPRQLAELSLPHPHATTAAKFYDQGYFHSTHPTQIFWRVGSETILARYFLIFQLCLKPSRLLTAVNGYSDYAFIPEMCPAEEEVVMSDSDEFFMLELQKRDHESHMLRLGRQSVEDFAGSLSEWTTVEHRRAARHDIVFHFGDIPDDIEAAKAAATSLISQIESKLGPPLSHVDHRYWVNGVEAWRDYRQAEGLRANPTELLPVGSLSMRDRSGIIARARALLRRLLFVAHRIVLGRPPRLTPLHPGWLDFRFLEDRIREIFAAPGAHVLVVRDRPDFVDDLLPTGVPTRVASVQEALDGNIFAAREDSSPYTHALICLTGTDWEHSYQIVSSCEKVMAQDGRCEVFLHHLRFYGDMGEDLIQHAAEVIGPLPRAVICRFVESSLLRRFAAFLLRGLYERRARRGNGTLILGAPLLAIALIISLMENLRQRAKGTSANLYSYFSSLSLQFTRRSD